MILAITREEERADFSGLWHHNQSVPADRIKTIFAGYAEKPGEYAAAKLQLWILPEGAPPPAAEAAPERRPEKAVKVGDQVVEEEVAGVENPQ